MERRCLASFAAVALSACATDQVYRWEPFDHGRPKVVIPKDARKIAVDGSEYRRLQDDELRGAIVGMDMTTPAITSPSGQRFFPDGTYRRERDLVGPAWGGYKVYRDEVCTTLGEETLLHMYNDCFAIFRNDKGELLITDFGEYTAPTRVTVSPLAPRSR